VRLFIVFAVATAALIAGCLYWAGHSIEIASWWLGRKQIVDPEVAGQWADTFGAFNTIVTVVGSSAVLATLWLQQRSLKDQAADLHRQRFESSYFELLRLLREARSQITFQHSKLYVEAQLAERPSRPRFVPLAHRTVHVGHDAIRVAVKELRYWLAPGRDKSLGKEVVIRIYEGQIHNNTNESGLGPYFRLVYTILFRLRNDVTLSAEEKASYGNLLRSQMTSEEITLLAVNSLSDFAKDLKDFLAEFRMLKYMPESSMKRRLRRILGDAAFLGRD
jgi:hypothetical protein